MRLLSLLLSASTLIGAAHAGQSIEQPQRMTGLWLLNTSAETQREPDYQLCVERGDENPLLNPLVNFESCDPSDWTGDWMFRSILMQCRDGAGTFSVTGRFEGDFQYSYQGRLTITYDSPRDGDAGRTLLYEGRRMAPCKEHTPRATFFREGENGPVSIAP